MALNKGTGAPSRTGQSRIALIPMSAPSF